MVSRLTLYCDRCDANDRTVEGTAERLGVDGVWYEIHLCDACRKELSEDAFVRVVEFFRDHGEEQGGGARLSEGEMSCLWCPKAYTSIGGLDNHLRTVHHFATPEEAWGGRCPACGSQDFSRLGTHASRTHHRHISLLMQEAIAQGDPYGVVKIRLRAVRR